MPKLTTPIIWLTAENVN